MLILIPAYKPDNSLVLLCKKLLLRRVSVPSLEILVVDDGSGPAYQPIFEQVRALGNSVGLLTQAENGGKGAALRAGFAWAHKNRPGVCVVTADADGQHLPGDILAVGMLTELRASAGKAAMVLGVRTVEDTQAPEGMKVPFRSRFGNAVTVGFFRLATGHRVADTQTGLRGLTPDVLAWALEIPGNRYEYEFSMLLRATRTDISLEQVPIVRVYEPGNPSSHFRPVQDSLRIYAPLLGFLLASVAGFVIDTLALLVLVACGVPLLLAVVLSRVFSALGNFALNRLIMHDGGVRLPAGISLVRYAVLAVGLLGLNAGLLEMLTALAVPLVIAKIAVELALVPVSFAVQRRWVFAEKHADLTSAETGQDEEERPTLATAP